MYMRYRKRERIYPIFNSHHVLEVLREQEGRRERQRLGNIASKCSGRRRSRLNRAEGVSTITAGSQNERRLNVIKCGEK